MKKNSQKKDMPLQVGDKVLCIGGLDFTFPDGDTVETGKIYTVTVVDISGIKVGKPSAGLTIWKTERFVPATSLLVELC